LLDVGLNEKDFNGFPGGWPQVKWFSVSYLEDFHGFFRGWSQMRGFSMAILKFGPKKEDCNGISGGWSQVRGSLKAPGGWLQR
jgi:hypothetical protein